MSMLHVPIFMAALSVSVIPLGSLVMELLVKVSANIIT